jgi:hypothetical protein
MCFDIPTILQFWQVVRYGKLRVTFSPSFKVSNYFTLVSAFQSGCMLLAVWKLMKSVGSHGSSLLLFIMKVHVLSDSQKVMTIIVFVLTSKCCCGVFSSILLMWFHVLLWLYVVSPLRVSYILRDTMMHTTEMARLGTLPKRFE